MTFNRMIIESELCKFAFRKVSFVLPRYDSNNLRVQSCCAGYRIRTANQRARETPTGYPKCAKALNNERATNMYVRTIAIPRTSVSSALMTRLEVRWHRR